MIRPRKRQKKSAPRENDVPQAYCPPRVILLMASISAGWAIR